MAKLCSFSGEENWHCLEISEEIRMPNLMDLWNSQPIVDWVLSYLHYLMFVPFALHHNLSLHQVSRLLGSNTKN